ncbi:SGNH/GDSL hydrolase family protein [Thorsellia anophelis]|uniref:Uncharacterized protein n=1 Tax=Thorsellia anophelis DSM 18579 TaxID=1123402 RepID=A0A1I0BJX0_9GAMM|nr:GDSL-type esterase/lipase family protein [Thorsellia anophelis]SET07300.1 hypothetical protein SAMN02583745_01292 [Thorsellia anophelis DSM 18579]
MQHSNSTKITDEIATMLSENQQLLDELDALMKENSTEAQVSHKSTSDEKTSLSSIPEPLISSEEQRSPSIDFTQLQNIVEIDSDDKSSENEFNEAPKASDEVTLGNNTYHFELKKVNNQHANQDSNKFLKESDSSLILIDNDTALNVEGVENSILHTPSHSPDLEFVNKNNHFEPISQEENKFSDETWLTITTILIGIWVFFWLNQNSINTYFQQKYHHSSPLEIFDSLMVWDIGEIINDKPIEVISSIFISKGDENSGLASDIENFEKDHDVIESQSKQISLAVLPLIYSTNDETEKLSKSVSYNLEEQPLESKRTSNGSVQDDLLTSEVEFKLRSIEQLSPGDANNPPRYGYLLKEGEKVFFAGDSLMQGVAPHVINKLKKEFNTSSINLSKQSTGLTYPKAYDWPKTIEKTLRENDDIGLLVMMLGANDPWDMQVKKGEPYLRFGTDIWNQEYQSRIDAIYRLAAAKGIGVIWISAPSMKKGNLNKGVLHLDTLYKQVTEHYGGIFLDSNIMFGYESDIYNAYATWNEKNSKIRADDGVHFTPTGQKIIAEYVLSVIGVLKLAPADETTAP